jgi:predicted DCC family thiol-disulfide oxidoreductase YuxK
MVPALPILYFDGRCGFCTAVVDWLERHSRTPLHARPWQAGGYQTHGLQRRDVERSVWWIDRDGSRVAAHAALTRALRACGAPWSALGALGELPVLRAIAAIVYRVIARARRRLPGTRPACERGPLACRE